MENSIYASCFKAFGLRTGVSDSYFGWQTQDSSDWLLFIKPKWHPDGNNGVSWKLGWPAQWGQYFYVVAFEISHSETSETK